MPLAIHALGTKEAGSPHFAELTEQEQEFVCMWAVESQVFNGGFCQVYFNGYGWCVEYALRGYTRLGMTLHAELVARAIEIVTHATECEGFDPQIPPEALEALDDPWYAMDDTASIYGPKAAFVRKNPACFPHVRLD